MRVSNPLKPEHLGMAFAYWLFRLNESGLAFAAVISRFQIPFRDVSRPQVELRSGQAPPPLAGASHDVLLKLP